MYSYCIIFLISFLVNYINTLITVGFQDVALLKYFRVVHGGSAVIRKGRITLTFLKMFHLNVLPRFRFISRNQQILKYIHRGSVYFLSSSQTSSALNNNHHLLQSVQRTSLTSLTPLRSQRNQVNMGIYYTCL